MFGTQNSTPRPVAEASIELLNRHLALTTAAQLFAKFAHWNVKGDGFYSAHKLFDKVYAQLQQQTDAIAERITALGGVANGLPGELAQIWIADASGAFAGLAADGAQNVRDNMRAMVAMQAYVANSFREAIALAATDAVTQNLFLGLAEDADHMLYFLEAGLRA